MTWQIKTSGLKACDYFLYRLKNGADNLFLLSFLSHFDFSFAGTSLTYLNMLFYY